MEIKSIQIEYLKKSGFYQVMNEGVKHVKVLPYLSVVQSVEGSYDIALGNGKALQTGEGGFFVSPSDVRQSIVHHVNHESQKMTCRWIFIDARINKALKFDEYYQPPAVLNKEQAEVMNRLFDKIFSSEDLWENYSDCYLLLKYLADISAPVKKSVPWEIGEAVSFMTEHYKNPLSIKELAAVANMSESNFYAAFKRYLGSSPIRYLNHYRLSLSAEWLAETNKSISEICYSAGIKDPLYFSKLFRQNYGMSPTQYRAFHQKKI